ncbi:MAG: hypothetical protein JKY56_25975 [Kofleriaceae bacterium]|nr:hypothetical protein [Kofleriaceae bacterium]
MLVGCSGSTSIGEADKALNAPQVRSSFDAGQTPVAGPPASEILARQALDALFRKQKLRIVNDVSCSAMCIDGESDSFEVTLDGYDPQLGIGYEYIAQEEIGLDVNPQEAKLLHNSRQILLVGPAPLERVLEQAKLFLQQCNLPASATPTK